MSLKTREEVERELRELDAKLNDPMEDARINQLVLEEIEPGLAEERRVLAHSAKMAPKRIRL